MAYKTNIDVSSILILMLLGSFWLLIKFAINGADPIQVFSIIVASNKTPTVPIIGDIMYRVCTIIRLINLSKLMETYDHLSLDDHNSYISGLHFLQANCSWMVCPTFDHYAMVAVWAWMVLRPLAIVVVLTRRVAEKLDTPLAHGFLWHGTLTSFRRCTSI